MTLLLKLYFMFFQIGLFSFGGGYVMLPMIAQQIESSALIPMEEFPDLLALSQMTPGPIAINAATYVGFRSGGLLGAFFATLGVITPAVILILLLLKIMARYHKSGVVSALLYGVKPVTVGLIMIAAVYFFERSIFKGVVFSGDILKMGLSFFNLPLLIIFVAVLVLAWKGKVSPIILTVASGAAAALIL